MSYTVTSNKYEWALANLRALRRSGKQVVTSNELNIEAADLIGLTDSQKREKSSNGKLRFVVVSEWSRTFLKNIQLFKRAGHGKWTIGNDRGEEINSVDHLKELERKISSKKYLYINTKTLNELLAKISFPPQTPTPVNATNLLFNTLAVAHVLTNRGVTEVDLAPNTESRSEITDAYGRLASIDPKNPAAGAINDLSIKPVGKTDKTPSSYISSGLYTAISRRTDDSPNTPGFALEGKIASLETGLAEFERIYSQLKDGRAKTSFAVFALRGLPIDNKELPLNSEKLRDAIEDAYGDDIAQLITSTFRSDPPNLITEENLSNLPGTIGESNSINSSKYMNHEQRLICALASKPFVILAGGTGTGKTKSAIETVIKLCNKAAAGLNSDQFAVIPVGADWTDTRPLIGYENVLRNPSTYTVPPALRIILAANRNAQEHNDSKGTSVLLPYFLILDEMNLSHVERYFSDFLSLMEAKKIDGSAAIIELHGNREGMRSTDDPNFTVPSSVPWPTNLFVIGTVNIDETAHTFSPKVLDRAHVIEYKPATDAVLKGIDQMIQSAKIPKEESQKARFENQGKFTQIGQTLVMTTRDKLIAAEDMNALNSAKAVVVEMLECLRSTKFAFSHRTSQEAVSYVLISKWMLNKHQAILAPAPSDQVLIDYAILQKILPKINGSTESLTVASPDGKERESLLTELLNACGPLNTEGKEAASYTYAKSAEKLVQMRDTLNREHFVSFIQ